MSTSADSNLLQGTRLLGLSDLASAPSSLVAAGAALDPEQCIVGDYGRLDAHSHGSPYLGIKSALLTQFNALTTVNVANIAQTAVPSDESLEYPIGTCSSTIPAQPSISMYTTNGIMSDPQDGRSHGGGQDVSLNQGKLKEIHSGFILPPRTDKPQYRSKPIGTDCTI